MIGRTLQWLGVAAILGLLGTGVALLTIVKDRIHITVEAAKSPDATDPIALVRDELQQVHTDLAAITKALGDNLQKIATQLEAQVTADEALRRELANPADAAELAALRKELQTFQQRILALGSLAADPRKKKAPKPTKPKPEPKKLATPSTEKPTKPKRKRGGFLSFQLPSQSFAFDACQRYRILPNLSRVGFDAKSTLHDFSGVTKNLRGDFQANLAGGKRPWTGSVQVTAATLKTGIDERDAGMWDRLGVKAHPTLTFTIRRFAPDTGGIDTKKQTARGTIHGSMSIRGKAKDIAMPVRISVDASKRVSIRGEMKLLLSDYGVEAPSQLGLITMQNEVKVWIALRARKVGSCR